MAENKSPAKDDATPAAGPKTVVSATKSKEPAREVGGRDGPDPTRFGDWEKNGRCIDF